MAEKQKPASITEAEELKDSAANKPTAQEEEAISPTRYGDWEKNGRCIDF